MMRFTRTAIRVALLIGVCGIGSPLVAEQPDYPGLSKLLFLLRAGIDPNSPYYSQDQGIWTYDITTKTFQPWVSFAYLAGPLAPLGRVNLAAFEDRLVLQGTDYYEFDVASGKLLRRYRGLPERFNTWAFQGAVVTETLARRLEITPGIYGFPVCPPSSSISGLGCTGPVQFPGYPGPVWTTTMFDRLLRRAIPHADKELELAKSFPDQSPSLEARFVATDPMRKGLWFWNVGRATADTGYTLHQQLTFSPTGNGGILDETPKMEQAWSLSTPRELRRVARQFTYSPALDSFFTLFSYDGLEYRLVRYPGDLSGEELIDRWVYTEDFQKPVTDSMTALPGALPERFTQVVPAIGHAPGANNTFWQSDAYLFNPSSGPISIRMRRVSRPQETAEYTLAAHASLKLPAVLKQLGGGPVSDGGDGVMTDALLIEAPYRWGAQLSVYTRTYTRSTTPGEEGGTYGQAIPAIPGTVGYSTHLPTFVFGVDTFTSESAFVLDKRDPAQYRHNLGVVNDSGDPLTVRLRSAWVVERPPSDPDLERTIVVAPQSVANVNLESLFPARVFSDRPPRFWITADRSAPIWLSMIDNRSGDSTFLPFSLFAIRSNPDSSMMVPAVGHTAGASGTFWRTDLYGLFPLVERGEDLQKPRAWFYPAAREMCSAEVATERLSGEFGAPSVPDAWGPHWHNVFGDVARQFSDCSQASHLRGALKLRLASWMSGFTRTYTTRADGGTFGEILPFYPAKGWPVQHFAGIDLNTNFRVNIGLFNALDRPVTHRLILYDVTGKIVAEKTFEMVSGQSLQEPLQSLFGISFGNGVYGLTILPLDNGEPGGSWAYVSIVDNITGDPTNWW